MCCGSVQPIIISVIFVEKLWELLDDRYVNFEYRESCICIRK